MKKVPIVIPSFEPDERLITLCDELYKENLRDVIIVNDGSGKEYDSFFTKIVDLYHFIILTHTVNRGKGKALKTAFNYLLNRENDIIGCVTADSDGQHCVQDIKKIIAEFKNEPSSLVLGCRNFNEKNVPKKSRIGNKITKVAFRLFGRLKISDTQTGLRAIPKDYMKELLNIEGDRFEFETNMLLENRGRYPIKEVSIETIYESRKNHQSHFKPFRDSLKIYKLIFKSFFHRQ